MSRQQFFARLYLGLAIVCLILSLARNARAASDPNEIILLDSQVYQSDLVVEGRIVAQMMGPDLKDAHVRITAVYRGSAKPGDEVFVAGLSEFTNPLKSGARSTVLQPRDPFILFLRTPASWEQRDFQESGGFVLTSVDRFRQRWDPGAQLIVRGEVYSSASFTVILSGRRTLFVTRGGRPFGRAGFPFPTSSAPLLEYRERLRASAARTADWHAHLDRPAVPEDIPWLIAFLKERYTPPLTPPEEPIDSDPIGELGAMHLAKLGDLSVCIEGIRANPAQRSAFLARLTDPAGRDFLLGKIADKSLPVPLRKTLIDLIPSIGVVHNVHTNRAIENKPRAFAEPITPGNDAYLTRIAQTAAGLVDSGEGDLASALIGVLDKELYVGGVSELEVQIVPDIHGAANVLRRLYSRGNLADDVRRQIENAMDAISDEEYGALNSPCGQIISVAHPSDAYPNRFGRLAPNTISVTCEFCRAGTIDPPPTAELILESIPSGNTYILPSTLNPTKNSQFGRGVFDESLRLPANFKPGKYQMHYRFTDGTRIVSEGHGSDLALPQSAPPMLSPSLFGPFGAPPAPQLWSRSRKAGMLAGVIAVPVLLLLDAVRRSLRQRRRIHRGLCPRCAYDLRFSSDRCPECGTPLSSNIERGIVRKCIARIVLVVSIAVLIATTVAWVRSYRVADCWVRTTSERADSVYYSRGAVVLNLLTTVGPPGWSHVGGDPQAFPRSMAESGDLPRWRMLGIEYSTLSDMLVAPMWAIAGLLAIGGLVMAHALRSLAQPRRQFTALIRPEVELEQSL